MNPDFAHISNSDILNIAKELKEEFDSLKGRLDKFYELTSSRIKYKRVLIDYIDSIFEEIRSRNIEVL